MINTTALKPHQRQPRRRKRKKNCANVGKKRKGEGWEVGGADYRLLEREAEGRPGLKEGDRETGKEGGRERGRKERRRMMQTRGHTLRPARNQPARISIPPTGTNATQLPFLPLVYRPRPTLTPAPPRLAPRRGPNTPTFTSIPDSIQRRVK